MEILNNIIISIMAPLFAAAATFFFTKKKYQTEVNKGELANIEQAITIYKQMAIDIRKELQVAIKDHEATKLLLRSTQERLLAVEKELHQLRTKR